MQPRHVSFPARLHLLAAALAALAALASSCSRSTPIRTLLADPARHENHIVRVRGEVTRTLGILGYGVYRLDDGTGSIAVVTKEGGAPMQGAHLDVAGRFRSAFVLGDQTVAVVIESQRRTVAD